MSMRMIETVFTGETLIGFVSDANSFKSVTDEYFEILDLDRDGILSLSELRRGLNRIVSVESEIAPEEETTDVYKAISERFGGEIGRDRFRDLVAEILEAMARAFGNSPAIMVVHCDGLIMKAVRHESGQGK